MSATGQAPLHAAARSADLATGLLLFAAMRQARVIINRRKARGTKDDREREEHRRADRDHRGEARATGRA